MDWSKLRVGEVVAAAAGILLLIVMIFLPWYSLGGLEEALGGVSVDATINALQAFGLLDILLFLTAIAAIGAAVLTATQSSVALPVAASVVVTALGVLVTLLVLYRIVDTPGYGGLLDPSLGVFVGLLLCVAIALGGFMSMRQEGPGFGQAHSGVQTGPTTPTRPAPPADPPAAGQAPAPSEPQPPPAGPQPPPPGPPPA